MFRFNFIEVRDNQVLLTLAYDNILHFACLYLGAVGLVVSVGELIKSICVYPRPFFLITRSKNTREQ